MNNIRRDRDGTLSQALQSHTRGFLHKYADIFVFCLVLSCILFSKSMYDEFQLAKAVCFIFFALMVFAAMLFYRQKPKVNFVFFVFTVFFLYVTVQIFASGFHPQFYYTLALLSPLSFIIPVLAEINWKKFLVFINMLVFLSSLYGLWQFFYVVPRPYSFFGNPIFFGEFMMINFPFLVVSFFCFKKNRPVFLINTGFSLLSIMLAASRGVFISLVICLVFLVFLLATSGMFVLKMTKAVIIYSACFVLLALALFLTPRFSGMMKNNISRSAGIFSANSGSVKNRMLMLKTAILMAHNNPVFGLGAGSYKYFYQKYQAESLNQDKNYSFISTSYAHNDYAQILAEFGITGLVLFLAFVFSLVFYYEKASYLLAPGDYVFSFALLASLTGTLVESFFNFPLFILPSCVLFWLYCGFLYSLTAGKNEKSVKISSGVCRLISAAVILTVIIVFFTKPFDFISNFYLKPGAAVKKSGSSITWSLKKAVEYNSCSYFARACLADSYASFKQFNEASAEYEKALALNPYAADLLYDAAIIYIGKGVSGMAENYLKKSIVLFPDFAAAHLALGNVLVALNRQQEAVNEFEIVQRINPGIVEKNYENNLVLFQEVTW